MKLRADWLMTALCVSLLVLAAGCFPAVIRMFNSHISGNPHWARVELGGGRAAFWIGFYATAAMGTLVWLGAKGKIPLSGTVDDFFKEENNPLRAGYFGNSRPALRSYLLMSAFVLFMLNDYVQFRHVPGGDFLGAPRFGDMGLFGVSLGYYHLLGADFSGAELLLFSTLAASFYLLWGGPLPRRSKWK